MHPGSNDATTPARLVATGIEKRFGDVVALDGVDLTVQPGQIHALLGENGAGKSTLGNVLAGIYRPDSGSLRIDGAEVRISSPLDAIRAGIGMVHQHFRLVESLTVAENLHLGWAETPRWTGRRFLNRHTEQLCEQFGFTLSAGRPVWQLSVGERQQLEILRVLARGARLLILDEPTAVLTPPESEELFRSARELREAGHSIIFVSHKLNEVLALADVVTVLRGGRIEASREAVATDATELAMLMTGSEATPQTSRVDKPTRTPVLSLRRVSALGSWGTRLLHGVDLTVHEREIVGVAGVSGNGQRELAEIATGVATPEHGAVLVGDTDLSKAGPREFARNGVGHIPHDRLAEAVAKSRSIVDNAILRDYRRPPISRRGLLSTPEAERFTTALVERADVRGAGRIQNPIGHLSGGNQQKLVAHREAAIASRLLVAALPTRGLDVSAAAAVRNLLLERRNAGCGVLLISEDLDELLGLSDRIVVMYGGRIVGEFPAESANRKEIGLHMGRGATCFAPDDEVGA